MFQLLTEVPSEHLSRPHAEVPSEMHIRTLAICAVEAVEGQRSVEQLSKWVTPEVLTSVYEQRRLRSNRQTAYRDDRRLVAAPGRILVSRNSPESVNCTVVMHAAHRSFGVTLRLEHIRQSWRATSLSVL